MTAREALTRLCAALPLIYAPRTTEQRLDEVAQRIERAYLKVTGHDRR